MEQFIKKDEVKIVFPKKYELFSQQVLDDSPDSFSFSNDKEIFITAKQIVIDIDACQKRKGKKLTDDEKEFLLTRHIRQPRIHVYRLGNIVYIQKARGTSKCEVHLPMVMMDRIKENARIRNKTLSQMFVEMADYYLVTYGDASKEIKDYIAERHDDLQYCDGGRPELGIPGDRRTRKSYQWPDYPKSMTVDKID